MHSSILLAMHDDPVRYWQDLTENYRQMSDRELLSLAGKPEDLTDIAHQVLRDEIKKRGLDKPQPPSPNLGSSPGGGRSYHHVVGGVFRDEYIPSESEEQGENEEDEETEAEYTWKTRL